MEVFMVLSDATAKAFLQGTPQQRYHDLIVLFTEGHDVSFSEPKVYVEDNRASDGAVPAGSY
jgi:hypothetical protein